MALYDVTRLSGPGALRAVARDMSGLKADTPTLARAPQVADGGIAVETNSRISAGPAPVEQDRVAQIRDALKDGSYPIIPAQISDAIIAARLMLGTGQ